MAAIVTELFPEKRVAQRKSEKVDNVLEQNKVYLRRKIKPSFQIFEKGVQNLCNSG